MTGRNPAPPLRLAELVATLSLVSDLGMGLPMEHALRQCLIAMRLGAPLRFEELTRCVPDVQDALVSILSDKAIAVPELPGSNMVFARPGFNVIATANTRDQGVNELSAALKRRFNYVFIPIVGDRKTEVRIVQQRSEELLRRYDLPARINPPKPWMSPVMTQSVRAVTARSPLDVPRQARP